MIFGTSQAKLDDPNICTDFDKAKAAYENDGYLIYDFGFSDELLDDVTMATKSMAEKFTRVQDMWRTNKNVKALGANSEVIKLLTKLYERRAFPFQTLNFCVGTQQATHADSVHFSSFPENFMCGVWVALEDIDMENGPLHYYEGSHKRPNATIFDIGTQENVVHFFEEAARPYEKKYGTIKRGQAVIWTANVLHGGDKIIDQTRSRLSQVTHYYFDDCFYMTPLHERDAPQDYVRYPYDFSKGRFILGRKHGKRVFPHFMTMARAHISNLIKRTPSF